jgi:DNA-binding phage protein
MGTTPREIVKLLNDIVPARMSRNEFCRQTGINRNSFDRYSAGIGCPTIETMIKMLPFIGNTFDVTILGKTFTIEVKPEP